MSEYILQSGVEYGKALITGDGYGKAVGVVEDRMNWNYCRSKATWYNPFGCFANPFNYEQVKSILNTYINLVVAKTIPEYEPNSSSANQIVQVVAKASSQNEDTVQRALQNLYYASADGTIQSKQYIFPYTYKENKKFQDTPPHIDAQDPLKDVKFWGKALLVTAVVGVGAYALSQANRAYSNVKDVTGKS